MIVLTLLGGATHANYMLTSFINLRSHCTQPLHPSLFEAWGLYVVGPFTSKSSAEDMHILAATDYFSKWAEAIALKEVKKGNVVDFIKHTSFLDMVCLARLS